MCESFNWFGSGGGDLAHCGTCHRPAWDHTGWLSDGKHRPFAPGELAQVKMVARKKGLLQ